MKRLLATVVAVGAISAAGILFAGAGMFGPVAPDVSALAAPLVPQGESKAIQRVTLRVDGLSCASCSYIVRQALMGTPGVLLAANVLPQFGLNLPNQLGILFAVAVKLPHGAVTAH